MIKANCLCSSIGFGIMLVGCFAVIARMRFKIPKFVRLSRRLSLNSSFDHSKYSVVENDFLLVRSLFCIFGYFLSLVLSHCSINPYKVRATILFLKMYKICVCHVSLKSLQTFYNLYFLEYFLSAVATHVNYLKLIIWYVSKHPYISSDSDYT